MPDHPALCKDDCARAWIIFFGEPNTSLDPKLRQDDRRGRAEGPIKMDVLKP